MEGNRVTTIQVNERTLLLLKKLKDQLNASSYDEVLTKKIFIKNKARSFAGSLAKYYKNKSIEEVLNELQDERRKSDRF